MADLESYGLSAGKIDHIFMFWRHVTAAGVQRHALTPGDYGASKDYLERLVKRYFRAGYQIRNLSTKLRDLEKPGGVVFLSFGPHRLGLARPWLLNSRAAIDSADAPFLIAREDDNVDTVPAVPVLAASRAEAVILVRKLANVEGVDKDRWRDYTCERIQHPMHRLLIHASGGRVMSFPTELERQLAIALSPTKRRRRAA